jgi:hypothetical protein
MQQAAPRTEKVPGVLSARRIVRAVAIVGVLGLTVAGCSTQATSAASVGDQTISEQVIFDRTAALAAQAQSTGGSAADPAALAELNRTQTTSAIRSRLLEVAAADRGVQITDEQVNAALSGGNAGDAANQLGTPQSQVDQTVRDLLRLEGLVSAAAATGVPITNVTARIDGVSVPTRDEAVATRTRFLADPQSVDAAIAASAQPLQPQTVSVLKNPTVAPTGVFNAQPGDVILYPISKGYYVVRVLERTVEPAVLTPDDLTAQQLGGKFDLGALMLAPYAEQAGVTVNPRLGVWDPLTLQVVPGGSGL